MDKKVITALGTIAVGGLLFGTSAFAAITQPSGYDLYKEALKNTKAVQSLTPMIELSVRDNGEEIFKVNFVTKLDKETKISSSDIVFDVQNQQKNVDIFVNDGNTVVKSEGSDVYKMLKTNKEGFHKEGKYHGQGHLEDMESIIDALIGNIETFINVSETSDGTRVIDLQLSENQISPVINAVTSVAVKNMADHSSKAVPVEGGFHDGITPELPKLVKNIRVSKIDVKAEVNSENLIEEQAIFFEIIGEDAEGKSHELVVGVDAGFTDFNSTAPDKVDLTGQEVQQIKHEFKHPR